MRAPGWPASLSLARSCASDGHTTVIRLTTDGHGIPVRAGLAVQPVVAMRIAQVAPLIERVPPQLYGGTERVVAFLTDELVRLGHDVTLFATGDSRTNARLVPVWPMALRLGDCRDSLAPHVLMVEQVARRAALFDVVHFHVSELHLPVARRLPAAHVTTLHGRLDLPELGPLYREFNDVPLVSISDAQREPLPDAAWIGTVHHGLPPDLLEFHPVQGVLI